jgi:hypothetical protein
MPYILEKNNISIIANNTKYSLQPNPANNFFIIRSDMSSSQYTVSLTDPLGKEIYCLKSQDTEVKIPTQNYSNGIYLVTIESKEGLISQKVLIQH